MKSEEGTWDGERLRTLATRAGTEDKSFTAICAALEAEGRSLREPIIAAATGSTRDAPAGTEKWKAHTARWFKSRQGGFELAGYALADDVWLKLEPTVLPLLNAIPASVGKPRIESLDRV
ncbi:MAG: family endonuclease [Hyphomicrobiales bacterium]|nr:family endonuclease [Hyphomicrobiales bacterium]